MSFPLDHTTSWHECECCHLLFVGKMHTLHCSACRSHKKPCWKKKRAKAAS